MACTTVYSDTNQGTLVKCQGIERREYSDYLVERVIKGSVSEKINNKLRLQSGYK